MLKRSSPIRLTLPWPPSVNHYWLRNRSGSVRVGPRGERFRSEVMLETLRQLKPLRSVLGPVAVSIVASPPDRRRRDLDNLLKATLDSLTHAKVYEDDSAIQALSVRWGSLVAGGRLDVIVEPILEELPSER